MRTVLTTLPYNVIELPNAVTRSYDFFYKNGVPKWRGTGYYYSRFRPGLGVSWVARAVRSKLTVLCRLFLHSWSF